MFGNLSPFFTNWGPATTTQGGILTASATVQPLGGPKQLNAPASATVPSLEFNNGTRNWISFGTVGLGAPTLTNRSAGVKVVLYNAEDGTHADHAIGMLDTTTSYVGFPQATSGYAFSIYGGTTQVAQFLGDGRLTTSGGRIKKIRTALTTPITHAATDSIIFSNMSSAGAVAVNLAASLATGFEVAIKDAKGDAGTNNITITPAGGGTIDGAATKVISTNYGGVFLYHAGSNVWYSI